MFLLRGLWAAIPPGLLVLSQVADGAYVLNHTYNTEKNSFFGGFHFRSSSYFNSLGGRKAEPSNGFVNYLSYKDAVAAGLVYYRNRQVFLSADSQLSLSPNSTGRKSIRLESKKRFNQGLLIADIAHMPGNACGIWPAFWTFNFGESPYGEVDIIEGTAHQAENRVSLHTCSQCSFNLSASMPAGEYGSFNAQPRRDCDLHADENCERGENSEGCGLSGGRGTFGDAFNSQGGGIYATLLDDIGVTIWFWPSPKAPEDVSNGKPNPDTWGHPMADFRSSKNCKVANHWKNQTIVINIDFCGDSVTKQGWLNDVKCSSDDFPTCKSFVAGNPQAYSEAYWLFNSIKLYQYT